MPSDGPFVIDLSGRRRHYDDTRKLQSWRYPLDGSYRGIDEAYQSIDRRQRFAMAYGMGLLRFAELFGLPLDEQVATWEWEGGACSA